MSRGTGFKTRCACPVKGWGLGRSRVIQVSQKQATRRRYRQIRWIIVDTLREFKVNVE